MDHDRFDRLSKRVAGWPLSRRRAVRALGAAGLAGSLFALRRGNAAADCPDITMCTFDCNTCPLEMGLADFPVPGGSAGTCWDWGSFSCLPCDRSKSWESLRVACNQTDARCAGYCEPRF